MQAFLPHPLHLIPVPATYPTRHRRHAPQLVSKAKTPPVSPRPLSSPPSPVTERRLRPRDTPIVNTKSDLPSLQKHPTIPRNLNVTRSKPRRQKAADLENRLHYVKEPPHDSPLVTHPEDWDSVFAARNQITVKWLWLVTAIARKLYRTYTQSFPEMRAALCASDLVQEGVCGLMQAVEKWDSSRGYPFDAFAFYSIKHAIIRAVQNQSRPIRLPVHVLEKLARMRKVREELELNQRQVSVDVIAKRAGVSQKAAELYLARSNITSSIDAPMRSSSSASVPEPASLSAIPLRDFLVDHSVDVAREVERSCTCEAVAQLVKSTDLLELERSVLFLKYGLGDGVERVRAEVSRILDMRVHTVRRAELSALKKLRDTIGDDISAWTELLS